MCFHSNAHTHARYRVTKKTPSSILKKKFCFIFVVFLLFDGSDVDIINFVNIIIALFALISVFLLIYFCTMVASSNRLTNNAVRFALDRQRTGALFVLFCVTKPKYYFCVEDTAKDFSM